MIFIAYMSPVVCFLHRYTLPYAPELMSFNTSKSSMLCWWCCAECCEEMDSLGLRSGEPGLAGGEKCCDLGEPPSSSEGEEVRSTDSPEL